MQCATSNQETDSNFLQLQAYGQELEEVSTYKYIGIDLSSSLPSKEHIDWTVKKAKSDLGFLRRNLHINSCDTKSAAYITLVRHLKYCASILSPHTVQSKPKLEMVQRRAARYFTNRCHNKSIVTDMLQDLNWETLELRRTKLQLVMIYKIINDVVDIPSYLYLTPATTQTRAHHSKLRQYPTSTDTFKYSFFPRTIPV